MKVLCLGAALLLSLTTLQASAQDDRFRTWCEG